jgi:hypothetical protein
MKVARRENNPKVRNKTERVEKCLSALEHVTRQK